MKKIILTAFIFFCVVFSLLAQDLIIKKSGEEIKGKVKMVSGTEVEYTRSDSSDAPSYKVAKAEVLMIMYSNGSKDIFSNETSSNNTSSGTTNSSGTRAAQRYYNYDLFDRKVPVTYLGIDFSKCKVVDENVENPKAMFSEINELLVKEKSKYNIKGAIRKAELPYQYSIVDKRNEAVSDKDLTGNTDATITLNDLQGIVDQYDVAAAGVRDGLALVIICEKLNKPRTEGEYYYVVFDVASKKIVISEKLEGRAGGNGARNYWARSVYETINLVKDKKYIGWKIMYRR